MKPSHRYLRKSYAMQRMAQAIERAIQGPTSKEKERAARWAAAWGLLCGIKTDGVRLRRSEVADVAEVPRRRASDQIEIPAAAAPPRAPAPLNEDAAPVAAGIFEAEKQAQTA